MSLSNAQVLEKPAPRVARVPRPRNPVEATAAPAPDAGPAPDAPASARRLPHPPGRRAHLWLAALVAGAVLAGIPAVTGEKPVISATASDYGLGESTEVSFAGGLEDADARRGISEAEAQARLNELAASRAARQPKTVVPTQGTLTTCFCRRWGTMHYGLDLAAPLGTPIVAAADGVVVRAGRASGYGNAVYIQDADGNVHIYGHMRYFSVSEGDLVTAGDQIAKVGNEGQSTGPHLHYEIHRGGMDGRPIDPAKWLAERGASI
ncbi:M23 family metallopeptidase [Blastococcus xanthinilyticus]|uniref:Peptidase M23-like protein n=1 Tax=Blastococcus xanthinilyticus TaxID=1564164 RepID=A0A5S5D1Y8_9ACTN|nr:M23 family metallopeptidase [Blastococcus xanthinilyticus]TYP89775.1 peptidase M23-like protein [Blastococcus xanthinilyticus]